MHAFRLGPRQKGDTHLKASSEDFHLIAASRSGQSTTISVFHIHLLLSSSFKVGFSLRSHIRHSFPKHRSSTSFSASAWVIPLPLPLPSSPSTTAPSAPPLPQNRHHRRRNLRHRPPHPSPSIYPLSRNHHLGEEPRYGRHVVQKSLPRC
jgi:hypothetical protein